MSKGRKRGAALAGVGLVGLLAWFFRGAIPGLGGDSVDPINPAASGTVVLSIVAKGDQCTLGDKTTACTEACAAVDPNARVTIDGTEGAHAAVTALEKCLRDKGVSDVAVKNR